MKMLCKKMILRQSKGLIFVPTGRFPGMNNNVIFEPESIKLIGESGVTLQVSCYENYFQRLTSKSKKSRTSQGP